MKKKKKPTPTFRSVPFSSRAMNDREDEEHTIRESERIIAELDPASRELYRPTHPVNLKEQRD
jgi:hypothetical protein